MGIRFNLFHSSLCFINCHFAASMEEVEKRNNVSSLHPSHHHTVTHSHPHRTITPSETRCYSPEYLTTNTQSLNMSEFIISWLHHRNYIIMTSPYSMVFWLGDMNYRIQTSPELTMEVIKAHADNFQTSMLLREDQLVQEMTKGTVFSDFAEGAIDFKPTYKYDLNTDNWDSR